MVHVVHKLPKKHKLLILTCISVMLVIALLPSEKATASRDNDSNVLEVGKRYELPIKASQLEKQLSTTPSPENKLEATNILIDKVEFNDFIVRHGDSLAVLFKRAGFSAQTLHKLVNTNSETRKLTKIHPGEVLSFAKTPSGELSHLKYALTKTDTLLVSLDNNNRYKTAIHSKEIETVNQTAGGKIKSSFWTAGITAGLTERQIMNFADIFGWDIDFANDIRKDDTFSLIYETHYVDGELISNGKIIAAEFINQGEKFTFT